MGKRNDYGKFAGNAVVADVKFSLSQEEPVKIRAYCRALQGKRKENQPGNYSNAGSFFKNPAGESAGRLIDASGFKGMRVGGAMVSEKHGNFLVNRGGATAADVKVLMRRIQEKVKKTVERMTGMRVMEANIHVQSVNIPKE